MSQHLEHDSEIAESSHSQMLELFTNADKPIVTAIEEDNELDHETMDSKLEDMFNGIHYPASYQWEHAYLQLCNFRDPDKV